MTFHVCKYLIGWWLGLAGLAGGAWAHAQIPETLPITVHPGITSEGDLFSFGQDIVVEGMVTGDVGSIGGNLFVTGEIQGNISVLNGSVFLKQGARVGGNLVCIGGQVIRHDEARVAGRLNHFFGPNKADSWLSSAKARFAFYFAVCLFLFLLVIGVFYIFPNQVSEASFELSQDVVRPLIFGVLSFSVFVLCLFFSFLLMVVMIGFPIFLLLSCGWMIVTAFGVVVVLHRLGQWLEHVSKGLFSAVTGVLIAVLLVALGLHIPILNVLLAGALVLLGWGIVIETRFGTNKSWLTRKKRYWAAG